MYLVFVKENEEHRVTGIAENMEEVKSILDKNDLVDLISHGKAYVMEGDIKLIRPETTPELLNIKKVIHKKNSYY